jgi:hypothetical protein
MRWRFAILSGMFLVLASGSWAQFKTSNSNDYFVQPFTRHPDFANAREYRFASTWLGLVEAKSPSEREEEKDADKAPKSLADKIWAVLNSSFGLWVLSSVVLAWITKTYSVRESRKAENLKKTETAKRLDTEIAFRVAMALDGTRINEARLQSSPTTPRGIYQVAYNYLENYFIKLSEERDFSVFPEYRERTFRALILELMTVVDTHEVPHLKRALDAYEELSEGGDIGSEDSSPQACLEAFAKVKELLQKEIILKRWKTLVDFLIVRKRADLAQSAR